MSGHCRGIRAGQEVVAEALERSRDVARAAHVEDDAVPGQAICFVAHVLAGLWLQRMWGREEIADIVADVAGELGRDPGAAGLEIAMEMLRDRDVLDLPPAVAIEAQLRIVLAFAPLDDISLWSRDSEERLVCQCALGVTAPSRRAQAAARAALDGGDAGNGEARGRALRTVPVVRWGHRHAVLVARPALRHLDRSLLLLRAAADIIGLVLERQALLERGSSRERSLVDASERRLAGVAFDLHDGPLQEIAVVAGQASRVRRRIARATGGAGNREALVGELADLQACLGDVERHLRSLCHSLQSDGMLRRPFADVIAGEAATFRERTGIVVDALVSGPVDEVPSRHRIGLLRIVQESLANVREHAGATNVTVRVAADERHVEASVTDDGCGFEVERTLVRAARCGHLGLVGIHERVRMLGGACAVHSRPGGPTMIAVVLPRADEHESAPEAALPRLRDVSARR